MEFLKYFLFLFNFDSLRLAMRVYWSWL